MTLFEIILIGIGLSMDAVAVSMTNGMVYRNLRVWAYIAMPLFFGVFQGVMPLAGYFAGGLFADFISRYAGIVIFLILGVIGGKMALEGIKHNKEAQKGVPISQVDRCELPGSQKRLTIGVLFFQAIATSIDAFAVGVGFSAARIDIAFAVLVIAAVTAVMVIFAIVIGRRFGDLLGNKAEVLGGAILVFIGIKALI